MTKVLFILALGFALSGCGDTPYYDKTYSFEEKEWNQRVMPSFTVDIKDTSKVYDFILTLRTTTSYSYNNLWVFLNSKTPSGLIAREPFQIRIANEDGSWFGTKSGTVVENPLVFRSRKFPEKGKFTFTVEQGITEETIDEVLDIGLRLTESK
ncbi:MAG: gliding motility lipoprotein GldH [Flavobacteriales bacterium]|jgi:gliding motility-associated lipoprotein GldH